MDYTFLSKSRKRVSRSISAENPDGRKNGGARASEGTGKKAAQNLGLGWKISPCIQIPPEKEICIADIEGMGLITSMWMTHTGMARLLILRIYWENESTPAVEVPLGDFFANAWGKYYENNSLMIQINPGYGLNCCWSMPFRNHCRITIENLQEDEVTFFYQINYELGEIEEECCYFHAYYHRSNPLAYMQPHHLLPKITGTGHYVGCSVFWQVNNNLWWGEGEIKFYLDDDEYPTICGTGTEDYFQGAWNFENPETKHYQAYSSPYAGFHPFLPDGIYKANTRFQMYRLHIQDPICFEKNIKIDLQALGWKNGYKEYLPLQDDISSVCYWYEENPGGYLRLKDKKDQLEII